MNVNNLARNIQLQNAANNLKRMIPAAAEIAGDADTRDITGKSLAEIQTQLNALNAAIANPPAPAPAQ